MVFTILISNTDDHLRNHAFLYASDDGWRLSPAYDLNPVPADVSPRVLATSIDGEDPTASLDLAYGVAAYFTLAPADARKIANETGRAVSRWRQAAARLGLRKAEIDRMASAFDHQDLKNALKA
jgi:serine/threonine-protein kinase HipA